MDSFYKSKTFTDCRIRVFENAVDIFPCDCMEIIEEEYKGRTAHIMKSTLISMVTALMCDVEIDNVDSYKIDIESTVEDFLLLGGQ